MWELEYKESWTLKNWCFWTVVLEKTLESLFNSQEIQPVHPKEISPEYSLERLMLKLKLQYFSHLTHFKTPCFCHWLKSGGEGDGSGWDGWMASLTQGTWVLVSSRSLWWTGRPGVLQSLGSQRVGHGWATELSWTEPIFIDHLPCVRFCTSCWI